MIRLLPIDAGTYVRSPLHGEDRMWQETNCYVDIWIETLHALGLDPVAGLAFTLSADFDGDQWQFIKFPLEDLRALYGLGVSELNPWKGLEHHIIEQLEMGRLVTAEVNSYFLPDTAGVAYKIEDVKSSIVPNLLDPEARRLGYFHNASYFELDGDDYDGLLRGAGDRGNALPPYVELIRLDGLVRREGRDLTDHAVDLIRAHLARRPSVSPVQRMAKRFDEDVEWLSSQGMEMFHLYAFATARQCGATAAYAGTDPY